MPLRESDLQMAVFKWANTLIHQYPELRWLHAIPNGGYRNAREAMSLSLQGVKPGIADIALDVARGPYHGLKIELKIGKGKLSKEQVEYLDFCRTQGYFAFSSNDFNEIKSNIENYLNLR